MPAALMLGTGLSFLVILLTVLCGCVATYVVTRFKVSQEVDALRMQLAEISSLRNAVEELTTFKVNSSLAQQAHTAPAESTTEIATSTSQEIPHEVLVVIAAAVAALLGKSAQLRSARMIQPMAENPWAQQGRVYVQASHNLARG